MPKQRTLISLPEDVISDIDQLVGTRKRSVFLTEIARRELKRLRLLKILENPDPIWKDEDHPEFGEDSADWVRRIRQESERRVPVRIPE